MKIDRDQPLIDLAHNEGFSTRTLNIIIREDFNNITDLLSYYRRHGNFTELESCGKKTSNELLSICKKYKDHQKSDYAKAAENLKDRQIKILLKYFRFRYNNLSKRSQDLLSEILEGNFLMLNIVEKFLEKIGFNELKKYKNVGKATVQELTKLQRSFAKLLLKTSTSNITSNFSDELIKAYLGSFGEDWLVNIWTDIYKENEVFPLFKFWNEIINSEKFFKDTERYIFLNYFNYYQSAKIKNTLEVIGDELGLTRERVRQVRNEMLENFYSKFSFLEILGSASTTLNNYEINLESDFIFISDSLVNEINKSEGTTFTKLFITKVFLFYCRNSHKMLGYELNYHSLQKSKKYLSLKSPYIFSNKLLSKFSTKDFINNINSRLQNDIKDTYTLNLRSFILRFCNSSDLSLIESLESPCKVIINNEFDLLVNMRGEIVFEKNKEKFNYEIIAEALQNLGYDKDGHHITEISKEVNELYPEIDYSSNLESLRGIINRYKSIFIHIGRNSTYALKEWERNFTELKGGTIRDIVEEFLINEHKPQHMSLVIEFVNRYRDTSSEVVYTNLKLDKSKRFQFFGNGFIGLYTKNYKEGDTNFNNLNGFVFSQKNLEKYLPDFYESVITEISNDCEVLKVQVRSTLDKKIEKGDLIVNQNEIVRFNHE